MLPLYHQNEGVTGQIMASISEKSDHKILDYGKSVEIPQIAGRRRGRPIWQHVAIILVGSLTFLSYFGFIGTFMDRIEDRFGLLSNSPDHAARWILRKFPLIGEPPIEAECGNPLSNTLDRWAQ